MNLEDKKPGRIAQFREDHPRIFIAVISIVGLLVVGMVLMGGYQNYKIEKAGGTVESDGSVTMPEDTAPAPAPVNTDGEDAGPDTINGGTDKQISMLQPALKEEYGTPPEGFVWDQQGNPLSIGVPSMSSDDVVFTYVRALSTLDIGMAQKLSRGSTVIDTYQGYFNLRDQSSRDYNDVFNRNMYRDGLLSIQILDVSNTSVFAENQRVYTVKASVLDFSNKEFWQKDKDKIFNTIYQYDATENDSAKAEEYVNNYIQNYYESPNAVRREVTFTLSMNKYPDLNSGWLVSGDKDLNDILTNADGVPTNRYIMSEYQKYKQDRQQKEREASNGQS